MLESRLARAGASPSIVKDVAMRLGALNWATFFRAHPDTPGKVAAFAYAFEHLEIAATSSCCRVAETAGDAETARRSHGASGRARGRGGTIAGEWDVAVRASLAEVKAI